MALSFRCTLESLAGFSGTFPICGDIVRRLLDYYQDLRIDPPLLEALKSRALSQKIVLETATRIDEAGRSELRPYQRVGSAWLRRVKRGILADAPGLGKTVMSLDAARQVGSSRPLVICQKSKIRDWKEHIIKWHGDLDRWTVTNYARVHELELSHDLIIVDEAHGMRNRRTNLAKGIFKVAKRAEYVFLLTGSPTVNETSDIWPLLRLCDPARFGSYWGFAFRFLMVRQGYMGLEVGEVRSDERGNLKKIVSPYLLRREELLKVAKPRWRTLDYQLLGAQRRMYREIVESDSAEWQGEEILALTPLSKITRLRQIALHPSLLFSSYTGPSKLDVLSDLLDERPGQVVIFSQYARLVELASARLGDQCVSYTGKLSGQQRGEVVARFKAGEVRCIALTYGVGGEGLDLQEADRAILLEYPWHVAGIEQAVGRILRFGQVSNDVEFIIVHATNTVDDTIREIVRSKRRVTVQEILRRSTD